MQLITNNEEKETDQNDDGNVEENNENSSGSAKSDELKSYSKYDFIPGEQILYFEDFSQDNIGDFPALWNTNGSAEVVTTNLFPGNWFNFPCEMQCGLMNF